ncbi:tyrosine-protein kinase receptor TYRO3 isoform X2 [Fundulus heteroclitus]|uniref:tyrosine-protein kinase receptor TYRO3 isoform X2 n=1 Tax=Fundulus heteroclitus TaxID=8078 RepID=UPI00165C8532|nr:tyrosine-protein kinase receptor TYRO3 isoform X2 [Fundulus heteroclitus]
MWSAENMVNFRTTIWPVSVMLWTLLWGAACDTQPPAEEVELFSSDKQTNLGWQSKPPGKWTELSLPVSAGSSVPVLQACEKGEERSVLSKWMERRDAHDLLMDISVAQEEESSGELSPLKVHLFDTDYAITKFSNGRTVLDLQNTKLFITVLPNSLSQYLNRSLSLNLGPVTRRGFQLAFSYRGECVFIASIRVYYKSCPDIVSNLTSFMKTAANSEPVFGRCVAGAVKSSPPVRECGPDGVWGSLQGACFCERGREEMDKACKACRMGYYKSTNGGGGCQLCPPNTRTTKEGSENCECLQGFGRLPSDPHDLGCSRRNPPGLITVIPALNNSGGEITPAPARESSFYRSIWLTVVILLSTVSLTVVIFAAMYYLRRNYTKLRSEPDQEMQLFPVSPEISYRLPHILESATDQPNISEGVIPLLVELGDDMLDSLKDVLVERNQLTLGKELGKGEFGSVYEGIFTQAGVDIQVAVKTMRVGIYSKQDLHEFLREAEIMKSFDHENVVRLLGVTLKKVEDSPLPLPLVILPYMKHGDLRRFLIATRYGDIPMFVPYQTLLRFMTDIAAGMDYLSSKGFLHRDLAARNCMLGDNLRVCVADFGLSKKICSSDYYRQKVVIRVPIKWMAIESLSESVYTTKSDVWSFGVTMWEIVSRGKTPYPAVHNYELLDLLASGHRLKPPEDCDPKLYEIMKSCWNSEPKLRPDFRHLLEELKGLLSELPVLEAWQEARYINQGLEAATGAAAESENLQTDSGGRQENVYLSSPVGAFGCGTVPP